MNRGDALKERTRRFALSIIAFVDEVPRTSSSTVIGRQLLISTTSVGANYRAACRAKSMKDFISKMGTVEEEADESMYWLELLLESKAQNSRQIEPLIKEIDEITAIIVASIKTAKRASQK